MAANHILQKLAKYQEFFRSNYFAIVQALDPRAKLEERYKDIVHGALRDEYNFGVEDEPLPSQQSEAAGPLTDEDFFFGLVEGRYSEDDEVGRYFRIRQDRERVSTLEFWKKHESMYPRLANMARDYLSAQATSVASESTFSMAGGLISDERKPLEHACAPKASLNRTCLTRGKR